MSVDSSHAITDRITEHIENHFGTARVLVHVEPDDGTHVQGIRPLDPSGTD
jgi:divalent metal cation (Fe/Co/Zn/Cd) transporter